MRGNPSPNPNHFPQALYPYVDMDRDNKLSYNDLILEGHSVTMAWFPQESGLRSGVFFRTYPSTSKMFSLKKWTNKQKIHVGSLFLFWSNFHLQAVILLVWATIDWLQRYKKYNQKLLKLHLKSYWKTQDFSLSLTMSWMFNDNRIVTINTVLESMKSHCLWCLYATAFSNHCKKLKVTSDLTPWDGQWKRWIFSVGMTIFFSSGSEDNRLGYFQNNPIKGWKCSLYQDTLDSYLNLSKESISVVSTLL